MIDGAFGGFAVVNAGLFLLTDSGTLTKTEENTAALVLGAIGTGLMWSSSAGHDRVSKCSAAKLVEELRVGSLDGTGPDGFGDLKGLVALEDGGFAVLNSPVHERRVFGPVGASVATHGGKGYHPDAFPDANSLMLGRNGRLWVPDARNGRMSVFDPKADFIESFPFADGNYGWVWNGATDRGVGGRVHR